MILGSHNSWSYLRPQKWWMRLLSFTARCQSADIKTQYEKYGVRCFDLRVRFDCTRRTLANGIVFAHGIVEYKYTYEDIRNDLEWLNSKRDCYVRILHEARRKSQHTDSTTRAFRLFCSIMEDAFPFIRFWGGRNLCDWQYDYDFEGTHGYKVLESREPTCDEKYASVTKPYLIDDIFPWLYAKTHNRRLLEGGTDKEILLLDFVNIR